MRRRRRKWKSALGWGLAWLAFALVLFGLVDLVGSVMWEGIRSFRFSMLFEPTQGIAGGLENAILGTFELVFIGVVFAAPLGILGGIFTSEFAPPRLAAAIRFVAEVLSGVPSIVIGYFGYLLLVLRFHWGFSALAGGVALTLIMLPYILRTTDTSLQQVSLFAARGGLGPRDDKNAGHLEDGMAARCLRDGHGSFARHRHWTRRDRSASLHRGMELEQSVARADPFAGGVSDVRRLHVPG